MIEESEENLEMTVALKLPYSRIADLICTGLECGSYATFHYNGYVKRDKFWIGNDSLWSKFTPHIHPALTVGSYVSLVDHYEVEALSEKHAPMTKGSLSYKRYRLNLRAIKRGFEIMRDKYPRLFAEFLKENEDAITGDVFLQCCLLGEVVYG